MKFYRRDPALALEGMSELTLEQIGAYNLIIDLLYCRDGIVPDDDALVARMLNRDVRLWRRLKRELMAAGKIRITVDRRLTANGVDVTRLLAEIRSTSARLQANIRWENFRKAKEINGALMQARNASISNKILRESSTNSESEKLARARERPKPEEAGEERPFGEVPIATVATETRPTIPVSDELAAIIRRQSNNR